jgi:hypothetical protein
MEVSGYTFERLGRVVPGRTEAGVVAVSVPQPAFDAPPDATVHDHGWGPFCRFRVPEGTPDCAGVFLLSVAGTPVFVGEGDDVADRLTETYGRIAPDACFDETQATRCRVNTSIFHAVRSGLDVELFVHRTDDFEGSATDNGALRELIVRDIVSEFEPAWNDAVDAVEVATAGAETPRRPSETLREKYRPLFEYLRGHDLDRVELTFAELEVVLGDTVPDAARTWRQWWAGGDHSHPHAAAWVDAGYEVASLSLSAERVVFERVRGDPSSSSATGRASDD